MVPSLNIHGIAPSHADVRRSIRGINVPSATGGGRHPVDHKSTLVEASVSIKPQQAWSDDAQESGDNSAADERYVLPNGHSEVSTRMAAIRAEACVGGRWRGVSSGLEAVLAVKHFDPGQHPVLYVRVRR